MAVRMDRRERSGVEIKGVEAERQRVPGWLGEAVLLGQYWLESGLVGYLEEEVRVVRGQMGQYEAVDFVLLLLSYAVSGEKTLRDFYKALAPMNEVLMGVWGDRASDAEHYRLDNSAKFAPPSLEDAVVHQHWQSLPDEQQSFDHPIVPSESENGDR